MVKKKSKKSPTKKKAAKRPAKKAVKAKAKGKKAPAKRKAAREAAPKLHLPWRESKPGETFLGIVDDFFSQVNVITLTLKKPLSVGDRIHVRGHTTDIQQAVSSMQIEHAPVQGAKPGDGVGIRIDGKARRGDYVYKAGA